jgi:O-methyltransferase involved in polyketide biosynthesis
MDRVRVPRENEPYLATLYGKALDARAPQPILGDRFADEAVRRIDFDFAKLKLPRNGDVSLPFRARHLDGWTRDFLAAHPDATVLHLGCGLDARVFRVGPPPSVRWFEVDLPEVLALRAQLYPSRPGTQTVATSVTDPQWLERIPADRPALVVAEGLVMYLSEAEGLALLRRITRRFSSGQIVFDAYGTWTVRVITLASRFTTGMRVHLRWGIDDPRALERQVPGLALEDAVPFLSMPGLVERLSVTRAQAAWYRLMGRSAFVRRSIAHVRYRF